VASYINTTNDIISNQKERKKTDIEVLALAEVGGAGAGGAAGASRARLLT